MTLTTITTQTGRPRLHLTDEQWQPCFELLKAQTRHSRQRFMKGSSTMETNYQQYCRFINSVLKTIRRCDHTVDYCYYIYQIAELLKYEPDLKTRLNSSDYLAPHFEVWLETH